MIKIAALITTTFIAIAWLSATGCATTCDTLKISKQTLADDRVLVKFKCRDKTVEATIKRVPECLDACWEAAK